MAFLTNLFIYKIYTKPKILRFAKRILNIFSFIDGLSEEERNKDDFYLTAFENQLESLGPEDELVRYYIRLESKAILEAEINKLGIDLHELPDDILNSGLSRKIEGVNGSYVYVAGQSSYSVMHMEDFGLNSFNIILSEGALKV